MISPEIGIFLVDRSWLLQWTRHDGVTQRRFFGNRKALIDAMTNVLADVRGPGDPFPIIDETITLEVPRRRVGDRE